MGKAVNSMHLKRAGKFLKYFLLSLVLLFILVVAGINLPFSQRAITEKVNGIFQKQRHTRPGGWNNTADQRKTWNRQASDYKNYG